MSDDNDDDVEDRDDDESDIDEFIAEDEDMDDAIQEAGVLIGEDLLNQRYINQNQAVPDQDKPIHRPATPSTYKYPDREVPSEMRSHPKIPRSSDTENEYPSITEHPQEPHPNEEHKVAPEVQQEESPTPNGTGEFRFAFRSRDKIPRSPL